MNHPRFGVAVGSLLAAVLPACEQPQPDAARGRPSRAAVRTGSVAQQQEPAGADAIWLNPLVEVQTVLRGETPAGVELRQACYLGERRLLLLRDYEHRQDAVPDLQWLVELTPSGDAGVARPITLPQAAVPSRLLPSPDRTQVAILGWLPHVPEAEVAAAAAAAVPPASADVDSRSSSVEPAAAAEAAEAEQSYNLTQPQSWLLGQARSTDKTAPATVEHNDQAAVESPTAARFSLLPTVGQVPVLYGADGALYFRPLGAATTKSGLIDVRTDWTASASIFKPGQGAALQAVDDPALLVSPDLLLATGLRPATLSAAAPQPAWDLYLWRSGRGLTSRWLLSLPVAADSLPDDSGSLLWINATRLAVLCPQSAGIDRLNWQVLSIDTAKPEPQLIADHLPPRSTLAVLAGCVLYCRPAGGGGAWELWAASPDGRRKRLLYSAAQTYSLSIADAFGAKLLLNQQYFGEGETSLHHGLIELALGPLPKWRVAAGAFRSPLNSGVIEFAVADDAAEGPRGAPADENFVPDSESAPADPADRYRRRERGGGLGSGGGERKDPPDLSLPGL